jgi:hypothetical protein
LDSAETAEEIPWSTLLINQVLFSLIIYTSTF